jgi:hypothetical protein
MHVKIDLFFFCWEELQNRLFDVGHQDIMDETLALHRAISTLLQHGLNTHRIDR